MIARPRGFTLMELLVVITIVGMLTAAMIPVMSAASDARRLREGARLVSTMLASAQSRAISSGRAVGVLFQPMKNNPAAAMELYLVESPPPYSGDTLNSVVLVKLTSKVITTSSGPQTVYPVTVTPNMPSTDAGWQTVRPGDVIRFNYRGATFYVDPGDTSPYVPVATSPNPPIPLPILPTDSTRTTTDKSTGKAYLNDPTLLPPQATSAAGAALSFQVLRQPIKTMDPPAQLADGSAVDLYFSGIDLAPSGTARPTPSVLGTSTGGLTNNTPPLIITFSPAGTLDQVYCGDGGSTYQMRPLSGIYLLVGKIERIQTGPSFSDPKSPPNYEDSDCRWVAVTRQSGLVTTAEVASVGSPPPLPSNPLTKNDINNIMNSRRYASGNQSSGGI
jgi:prepilin-type N-terminal cleavage/methylation domain-containing protein